MTTCGLPFYLKPVVVAAYELLIELDDGFDKRDGMNQLRPCLCWLQVVYVMFGYTPMPQLFCWVVFSTGHQILGFSFGGFLHVCFGRSSVHVPIHFSA